MGVEFIKTPKWISTGIHLWNSQELMVLNVWYDHPYWDWGY